MQKEIIFNGNKIIELTNKVSTLQMHTGYNGLLMYANYDIPDNVQRIEISTNRTKEDMMIFIIKMISKSKSEINIDKYIYECDSFNIYQVNHIIYPEDETLELYFTDGIDDYSDKERYFPFTVEDIKNIRAE